MITRFPVLEYLSKKVGRYEIDATGLSIQLMRAGYGFALQIDEPSPKSPLFGVIGVSGNDLELHTNAGLSNVLVFKWRHDFIEISQDDLTIEFYQPDIAMTLVMAFVQTELRISFKFNSKTSKTVVGVKA
jgi:hypothetical protein